MQRSIKYMVFVILFMLLVVLTITGRGIVEREGYYHGVNDACLRSRMVNNSYTLFDVQVCREVTAHAREERWFEKEIVK